MEIEKLKEMIERREIDKIISGVSIISKDDSQIALDLIEKYFNKEVRIANDVMDIFANSKTQRMKDKIPYTGVYSYNLEE